MFFKTNQPFLSQKFNKNSISDFWNYLCQLICRLKPYIFMPKLKALWYFLCSVLWKSLCFFLQLLWNNLSALTKIPHWRQGTQLRPLTPPPPILSVRVGYQTALFGIDRIFKTTLSQCAPMYDAHPLLSYRFTEQRRLKRRVTTASSGKREKSKTRRKRKRLVMNYRADHFRLGPGRGRGRAFHPVFFHALSGTWEATGESNLWPIEAAATSLGRQWVDP